MARGGVAHQGSDTRNLALTGPGTAGQVLMSNGAGADPTFEDATGGSASDSFKTIQVSGQSDVVADSSTDTLTLVAGSNVTITTDASTDTITIASTGGGSGAVVQVVNTQTGAVATGTGLIPFDDTIPQNTEGDQYMSLSVTPTNSSHKLKIDVALFGSTTGSGGFIQAALFQDSTANALAAGWAVYPSATTAPAGLFFTHYMTAGTTSATTFKVRAGNHVGGTMTFNGQSGGRILGGVLASSVTITEIVP